MRFLENDFEGGSPPVKIVYCAILQYGGGICVQCDWGQMNWRHLYDKGLSHKKV